MLINIIMFLSLRVKRSLIQVEAITISAPLGLLRLPDVINVIVISKLIKCYSKAKRTRAPAHSRALRRIKGVSKGGQEKLRSDFQSTRREALLTLSKVKRHLKAEHSFTSARHVG